MVNYKLNNWFLTMDDGKGIMSLHGNVEGHPFTMDEALVTVSRVVGKTEGKIVTESGSLIELGNPKADYEELFPNARERLLESIPVVIA